MWFLEINKIFLIVYYRNFFKKYLQGSTCNPLPCNKYMHFTGFYWDTGKPCKFYCKNICSACSFIPKQGHSHAFESEGAQSPKAILGPFCLKKWEGPSLLLLLTTAGVVTYLKVRGPYVLRPLRALFASKSGRAQIYFYYCLAWKVGGGGAVPPSP